MSGGFVARGGWWVAAQFVIIAAAGAAGPLFAHPGRTPSTANAGGALLILGGLLALSGFLALGRQTTPFIRPRRPGQLVTSGIYRLVRHPLYGSLMLAAAGWAVFWLSWMALLGAIALTVFLVLKSTREEQFLLSLYSEYADYRRHSKRFFPWLW